MEKWQENAIKNILDVIRDSGLSQKEFAKKAEQTEKHLSSVLTGKKPVTTKLIRAVAKVVKQDTEWFYVDHNAPTVHQIQTVEFLHKLGKIPAEILGYLTDENVDWNEVFVRLLNKPAPEQYRSKVKAAKRS